MELKDMLDQKSLGDLKEVRKNLALEKTPRKTNSEKISSYDTLKSGLNNDYIRMQNFYDFMAENPVSLEEVDKFYSQLNDKYSSEKYSEELQEFLPCILESMKKNRIQSEEYVLNNHPVEDRTCANSGEVVQEEVGSLEKAVLNSELKIGNDDSSVKEVGSFYGLKVGEEEDFDKYKKFMKKVKKVSNKNIWNVLRYGGLTGEIYEAFNGEWNNLDKIDNKIDKALYNLDTVEILNEQGRENVKQLEGIIKNQGTLVFNSESKVIESRDILNSLRKEYFLLQDKYELAKGETLTVLDKAKNIFYSIFDKKKKIEKGPKTLDEVKLIVALENEMNSLKKEIQYNSKIFKNDKKIFKNDKNRLRNFKRDFVKINNFLNNSKNVQDFYQNYVDNTTKKLLNFEKEENMIPENRMFFMGEELVNNVPQPRQLVFEIER